MKQSIILCHRGRLYGRLVVLLSLRIPYTPKTISSVPWLRFWTLFISPSRGKEKKRMPERSLVSLVDIRFWQCSLDLHVFTHDSPLRARLMLQIVNYCKHKLHDVGTLHTTLTGFISEFCLLLQFIYILWLLLCEVVVRSLSVKHNE